MCMLRGVLTVLLAFAPTVALAWNDRGHMMVAAVAWANLDPEIRVRVSELVRRNPHYDRLTVQSTKDNKDQVAFIRAATWPDMIKEGAKKPSEHPKPNEYVNHGNDPSKSPDANRNIGYKDMFLHKYWHFVDLPFSRDGTTTKPPKEPNALTRIRLHRDTLASKDANEDVKAYDLVWLLHLVGDVHQPLHATARFSAALPEGDGGGNLTFICDRDPCNDDTKKSLHSFWDGAARSNSDVHSVINAAAALDEPDDALADIDDPAVWVAESFETATASVYVPPIGSSEELVPLPSGYKGAALDTAKKRIALAGVRLANLLNTALRKSVESFH